MKKYKRIFTIVIDSLGVGEMSDAEEYGDIGADTLGHISESIESFKIPNLQKVGLANLHPLKNVNPVEKPLAHFMKMGEASVGKDTMTGHWEMMGLKIETPFKTFTDEGFPEELLEELKTRTGRNIVGNKSASGTEILDEFGEHQMNTGDMIVYTSADSVLQICGHEETFGLEELYRCCKIARELTLKDEWKVGRVIARPYIGAKKGEFKRTSNRHDYALKPFGKTVLDTLKDKGLDVIAVGKISDIFDGEGITESHKSKSSIHGMEQTLEVMDKDFQGLCFINLVDFDALWGHRRNPVGYAEELEKFDVNLGKVLKKLKEDDLLIITADHGNDPTYKGTDHTREYVPFLAYSPSMIENGLIETSNSFGAIGATIAANFQIEMPENTIGESVLEKLV
jgi:phosphopentomutase